MKLTQVAGKEPISN